VSSRISEKSQERRLLVPNKSLGGLFLSAPEEVVKVLEVAVINAERTRITPD
jgi:hypothetical protein